MASVDWQKIHGAAEAGAKKAHFDEALRATVDHENEHIDRSLSHLNYALGVASYAEAVRRMEERTKEVDAVLPPQRVRKDRVTGLSLYTVCPEEIQKAGKEDEYFRKVHEAFCRIFGPENVHGSFIHKDERHEYLDTRTGETRTSLYHAHTIISAYVPGKGINGKQACTRSSMRTVNKALEEICREYGIEWHTGRGKESRTMDELKAESARLERQRQEELLLNPGRVAEIQQKKAILSKDEVTVKREDLQRLQQAAGMATQLMEKAEELQRQRDRLHGALELEKEKAPEKLRQAEKEAEQIRQAAEHEALRIQREAERTAERIRQEVEAEIRQAWKKHEAMKAAIRRMEDLLDEKRTFFDSPDGSVLKLQRIVSEIAEQEERDRCALAFDRIDRHGEGIEKLLRIARETWRRNVPEKYRSPELESRQNMRRDWEKDRGER